MIFRVSSLLGIRAYPFFWGLPLGICINQYFDDGSRYFGFSKLMNQGSVELVLTGFGRELSEAFRIVQVPKNSIFGNKENQKIFGFSYIKVNEEYRQLGICTILICKAILYVLKNDSKRDFVFYLVNTSNIKVVPDAEVQYRIYDSVFDKIDSNDKRLQYVCFDRKNRKSDIKKLETIMNKKLWKLSKFLYFKMVVSCLKGFRK